MIHYDENYSDKEVSSQEGERSTQRPIVHRYPPNACNIHGQKYQLEFYLEVGRCREKMGPFVEFTLVEVVWLRAGFASHLQLVDFVGRKQG
jgi:hypothetical protein